MPSEHEHAAESCVGRTTYRIDVLKETFTVDSPFVLRDASLTNSRLESIGKRLAEGRETVQDLAIIEKFQRHIARGTNEMFEKIGSLVASTRPTPIVMTERPRKRLDSIRKKLQREKTRLSTMQDLAGCRIIAASQLEADQLLEVLRSSFPGDTRFPNGSRSGYRAIHFIAHANELKYEVQIRTDVEDAWAQLSESLDERYPGAKYGNGPEIVTEVLKNLSREISFFEEIRDLAIHDAADRELEIDPAKIGQVGFARRRIEVLVEKIQEQL